jgi:AGZA family xanthine/uracil permease-like MFS transporter
MGLFANLPLGLAPGLGGELLRDLHVTITTCRNDDSPTVNAYFAYSQVGFNVSSKPEHNTSHAADQQGTGPISYGEALAAVFLEGLIFFALTILGLRQWLARIIPRSITAAIGCGIGLFLTIIGLSSSGLNVISGGTSTPLQLAGCPAQYADETTGFCSGHVLQDPRVWLGVFVGGILTGFLLLYRVKGESRRCRNHVSV